MKKKEYMNPTMQVKELRHRTHLLSGSDRYVNSVRGYKMNGGTPEETDEVGYGGAGVWEVR